MADYVGLETSGHVLLETTGGLLLETSTVGPGPTGVLALAFDDPTLEPFPVWTRVDTLAGCRVRGFQVDRGRPTEFDKTGVGTAVVQIVDRQGLFDPSNTLSPYYGKVVPGKQAAVCLQSPVNDTWHTLFRGYVESWHYRLDPTRQYMELELQLVDGFAVLARAELRVGVDGTLPLPAEIAEGNVGYGRNDVDGTVTDRIEAILKDVGWPVELSVPWHDPNPDEVPDLFSGNVRVGPKAYGPGTSALDALWDAADAEFPGVSNMWMGGPGGFDGVGSPRAGHLIFRGRQARFRPDVVEYGIERRTVGDPSAWDVTVDPTHQVVPVSELEWSNGDDNLFNACTATPQGILPAAGPWRQLDPKKDDIAGQLVKAGDVGLTAGASYDAASIDHYGLRSLTFDNLQTMEGIHTGNNSLQETKLFATYYVENYSAAPQARISRMVFKSRRPDDPHGPALWQHMCNCDISDLLTLKTQHPGGGGFASEDFYVEGIHYTCRPGSPDIPQIVELTLDVSPRAHWDTNPFDTDTDPA